jgi:hypothetical protein
MKRILFLLVALAFMACQEGTRQEEKKEEMKEGVEKIGQDVRETAAAAGDYMDAQRDSLRKDLEERRREIDLKMEELKKDGSRKSEKARAKLADLRDQIDSKLTDIKSSSATTWDSTRKDINVLMKKTDEEWKEFKSDFKELFR